MTVPASSAEGSVNVTAIVSNGTATVNVTDAQLNQIISDDTTGTVKVDLSGLAVDEAIIPSKLVSAAAEAPELTAWRSSSPTVLSR